MTNISDIAKKLSEKITNAETRQRSRTVEEYQRFLYAIEYILTDIWKASYIHPEQNVLFISTITTTLVTQDTVTQT